MVKKELKSKQFNGKVKPSLYEDLTKIVYLRREKINRVLEQWIINYIEEHRDDLDKWYEVFGSEQEKAMYFGKDHPSYDSWYDDDSEYEPEPYEEWV